MSPLHAQSSNPSARTSRICAAYHERSMPAIRYAAAMRRAALAVVVVELLGCASRAWAEPWTVTMEGGGEADSNVQRVESGQGAMPRIAAPVGRTGARLDHKDHLLGGAYAIGLSGL